MNLAGTDPLLSAVVRKVEVGARSTVIQQGDLPRVAHLLVQGQAYRYRLLPDGRRQITAFLVPGDVCDLEAVMRGRADFGVVAATSCVLGEMPADAVNSTGELDLDLQQALHRQLLRNEAIAREWMVGLGRRSAGERLAHLICELHERLWHAGAGERYRYRLELTQDELADILGLSNVHINRTLTELRRVGLMEFRNKVVHILDHTALTQLADFDATYLELVGH